MRAFCQGLPALAIYAPPLTGLKALQTRSCTPIREGPAIALKPGEIGKPLWISARWANTRGEPGVFSPIQDTVIS